MHITEYLQRIGDAVGNWLYLIAGGLAFAEAAILVGVVLPGETALLVAGYFCHEGPLNLAVMIAVAIACAIVGDSVGYEFGRWFGPRLRQSRVGLVVGESRWGKGDAFLHRHGGKAVLLGRAVALLRALVPSMAGMARMPYRTFLPWNALGGALWGTTCVLLGYLFAGALSTVEKYLTWGPLAVLGALIVIVAYRRIAKRRHERTERARTDEMPDAVLEESDRARSAP
ncbi:MAG: DedA family protein [Mycobacteriales bacterium]